MTISFGNLSKATVAGLSGCYFGAFAEGHHQPAFVQGVLQKLISEQDNVAWSEDRLERDRRCHAWAFRLFALAILLAVANCGLLWRLQS